MSLRTFLKRIWHKIENVFAGLPNEIKVALHIGILITENIKTFVDSPATDVLTVLIPGNLDDIMKDKLKISLPILLCELKLVENTLSVTQPDAIAKAAIETIKATDENIKGGILHQLSILIAQLAADGKLSWSDGVYLSQWYYEQKFKTNN